MMLQELTTKRCPEQKLALRRVARGAVACAALLAVVVPAALVPPAQAQGTLPYSVFEITPQGNGTFRFTWEIRNPTRATASRQVQVVAVPTNGAPTESLADTTVTVPSANPVTGNAGSRSTSTLWMPVEIAPHDIYPTDEPGRRLRAEPSGLFVTQISTSAAVMGCPTLIIIVAQDQRPGSRRGARTIDVRLAGPDRSQLASQMRFDLRDGVSGRQYLLWTPTAPGEATITAAELDFRVRVGEGPCSPPPEIPPDARPFGGGLPPGTPGGSTPPAETPAPGGPQVAQQPEQVVPPAPATEAAPTEDMFSQSPRPRIGRVTMNPPVPEQGSPTRITFEIENAGGGAGPVRVNVFITESDSPTAEFVVGPDETTTVTVEWTPDRSGVIPIDVRVFNLEGEPAGDGLSLEIEVAPAAEVTIEERPGEFAPPTPPFDDTAVM
jgi:hypothetical protein